MYFYSAGVTIHSPFGYINDPDTNEQNLFCGDPDYFINAGNTYTDAQTAVQSQYSDGKTPCEQVTFFCNNYTNTENNCTMIQDYDDDEDYFSSIGSIAFQCFPTFLTSIYKNLCLGSCPNSPTQAPTAAPSFAPTATTSTPTAAPSYSPTPAPSIAPTDRPTATPSSAPSVAPSLAPTLSPTLSPSLAPSIAPSLAPTLTPTSPPTTAPSSAPSIAPTAAPTLDPTDAPSFSPSAIPTNAPTIKPTAAPSVAPSKAPSVAPTMTPTGEPTATPSFAPTAKPSEAPTNSPTPAPTRAPTEGDTFTHYLPIIYTFGNLTDEIKANISSKRGKMIPLIQRIIERGYFDEKFLKYSQFRVLINKINEDLVEKLTDDSWIFWGKEKDPLTLECQIDCDFSDCVFISNIDMSNAIINPSGRRLLAKQETTEQCNQLTAFQAITQCNLATYFDRNVDFTVNNADTFSEESVVCSKDCGNSASFDYVLWSIMGFLGLMAFISILAFLYNKRFLCTLPGFNPVDDAQWTALLIFGIQAWDFVSDINLSFEIWGDLNGNTVPDTDDEAYTGFKDANILILIAAVGSTASIVLPYVVNLAIAANIKRLIRKNNAAKAYFQYYSAIYVLFVVLSGGAYPALAVVSSNIFGLVMFNSGLTKYEMKKLSKIKIFGTIILENLPQLFCQVLYSYVLDEITETTQLAFCASLLSVTASTLSYWIEKNAADTTAVQYYLSFECSHKMRGGTKERGQNSGILPYDDIGDEEDADQIATAKTFNMSGEEIVNDKENLEDYGPAQNVKKLGLTEEEKLLCLKHKGLKFALSEGMAEVFGVSSNNLEIGYTQITKYGIIVHIVHYVYNSDLEEIEEESNVSIGASFFTSQLYSNHIKEINQVFRTHYKFPNAKEFEVRYSRKYPSDTMGKAATNKILPGTNGDADDGDEPMNEKRASVMQQMMKRMQTLSGLPAVEKEGGLRKYRGLLGDEETLYDGGDVEMIDMTGTRRNNEVDVKRRLNNVMRKCKFVSEVEKREFLMGWINDDEKKIEEEDEVNNIYDDGQDDETGAPFIQDKTVSVAL